MQEVTLYARGSCKSNEENKPGFWETLTVIEGNKKYQSGEGFNTSCNRMIIQGLIEAVKNLEKPSNIKIVTHALIGAKSAKKGKGVNKDLLQELFNLIDKGEHRASLISDPDKMKKLVWLPDNQKINIEPDTKKEKTVSLYVKGSCQYMTEDRKGSWVAFLCFNGREKVIYGESNNTTDKQMLIKGIIESVKCLKEPCHVKVYTAGSLGLKNYQKGKGVNKDLIKQMFEVLAERNHSVEFILNTERAEDLERALKMNKEIR